MAGIESMFQNKFDLAGAIAMSNDPTQNDKELLSQLTGLRVFELAENPEQCRIVIESMLSLTDGERQATQIVIGLLAKFEHYNNDKTAALMNYNDVEQSLKIDIMEQSIAMTAILASITQMLELLSEAKTMEILISKEMAEGLRIIRKGKRMNVEILTKLK